VVRLVLACERDGLGDAALVEVYEPKGGLSMLLVSNGDVSFCEWWQRGNPVMTVRSDRDGEVSVEVLQADASTEAFRWDNGPQGGQPP